MCVCFRKQKRKNVNLKEYSIIKKNFLIKTKNDDNSSINKKVIIKKKTYTLENAAALSAVRSVDFLLEVVDGELAASNTDSKK